MDRKYIYTVGYTLFQKGNSIDVCHLFDTLIKYGVNFLIDVRSVPFSKQYPQCNADNMRITGKELDIPYMNMPEIGAKASSPQEVFSKASDIFFEQDIFPIAKSYRPEKTELHASDEIVDFRKFRHDEHFVSGLKRIENAYNKNFTLCLMCSEKKPMDCHRYFLVSKALEQRYGDWLEIRHIVEKPDGEIYFISNSDLDKQLKIFVCERKKIQKMLSEEKTLDKYFGKTEQEKLYDFCDRYWNILHGWKKINYNNTENYD